MYRAGFSFIYKDVLWKKSVTFDWLVLRLSQSTLHLLYFLLLLSECVSCLINEVKNKVICRLRIKEVVVGRINGVVALTGSFYKKMYGHFAGLK